MTNEVKEFFDSIADSWTNDDNNYETIDYLFSLIDIKNDDDVLDLGCGKGVITPMIYKHTNKKVIGMDLSPKMIEYAKIINNDIDKYEFIASDFFDYNFNQKFDKIIIFNAFPHFLDRTLLAKRANDNLKEEGRLIIMHDLGRKSLNNHHKQKASKISLGLDLPEAEYKSFSSYFKLIKAIDADDKYLMILEKK